MRLRDRTPLRQTTVASTSMAFTAGAAQRLPRTRSAWPFCRRVVATPSWRSCSLVQHEAVRPARFGYANHMDDNADGYYTEECQQT
jgi:hypothetical protein